jgi:hypothetical protein
MADKIPGLGMEAIVQNLGTDPSLPGAVTLENSAVFR